MLQQLFHDSKYIYQNIFLVFGQFALEELCENKTKPKTVATMYCYYTNYPQTQFLQQEYLLIDMSL